MVSGRIRGPFYMFSSLFHQFREKKVFVRDDPSFFTNYAMKLTNCSIKALKFEGV